MKIVGRVRELGTAEANRFLQGRAEQVADDVVAAREAGHRPGRDRDERLARLVASEGSPVMTAR